MYRTTTEMYRTATEMYIVWDKATAWCRKTLQNGEDKATEYCRTKLQGAGGQSHSIEW
jgi:hypothetical protein